VLEAMASGVCVVSTDVGGIPYLIEHDRDALLVPPDNPQAMADAVARLLDDSQLADRLSREARLKVERFDWGPIMGEWRSLLASTAAKAS
jgi:glycosyltransferase involved in cell wall biosynthesis